MDFEAQMIKSTRKIIETSISCVQGLFPKALAARTSKGFELKLIMFLLAKSCTDYFTAARLWTQTGFEANHQFLER